MATTNAALTQANNALKNLKMANTAQMNAEAGKNVSANLAKMNGSYKMAANGFRNVANKMNKMNLPQIAQNFKVAANASEAAAAAKAARSAAAGLNKLKNAMTTNLNRVNTGLPPSNAAGLV